MRVRWDIFCRVIDNFGDVGVTWRLARQLAAEHDVEVRLWIDDLPSFVRLCPLADANTYQQLQQGVEICYWSEQWRSVEPADVVIEAFACTLPADYLRAMTQSAKPLLWLNLEYLSAESWVDGCHALPSLQADGLQKFFFFPGFSAASGGLLREQGLVEQRQAFQSDRAAQQRFLADLGVAASPDARIISLFAYENPALPSWLEQLSQESQSTQLLVPEGRCLATIQDWLQEPTLKVGDVVQRGQLSLHVLPFMSQQEYDRLLWCCDFNLVRGEDSFVRAQWAGRPMLWHIYAQEGDAHLEKLDAFLERYVHGLSPTSQQALIDFYQVWNKGQDMTQSWLNIQQSWPELAVYADLWCKECAIQPDLVTALVRFYRNWL